jgi:hypothetical protein
MSRSERKPVWTLGYGGKYRKKAKKAANQAVKDADVPSGSAYKKVYNSWDIVDYKSYDPKPEKPWKVKRK